MYLLSIGSRGYLDFTPNKFLTELDVHNAISHLVYRGESSKMADGLSLARKILTEEAYGIRSDVPKTILIIAAGTPDNVKLTTTEANLIKAANIRIIAVGVGPKVS